jgi:hypothetical protein
MKEGAQVNTDRNIDAANISAEEMAPASFHSHH